MKVDLTACADPMTGYIRMVFRRFDLNKGEIHEGHTHDEDHVTVLWTGKISIRYTRPDGTEGKREYAAPCHFWVCKDIEHEITALEDGTSWGCFFLPPEGYENDLKEFWNETNLYV